MRTPANHRRFLGIALLIALVVGFSLGRLADEWSPSPRSTLENDHHDRDGEHLHGDDEDLVILTSRQIEASGITLVSVEYGGGQEVRLGGRVETAIDAKVTVAAAIGGRVEQLIAAPGATVEAGDPLAVLISGEAAVLRARADAARADAEAANLVYQRDLNLVDQGVVARQELEASRARSLAAAATARAVAAQVAAIGSPDAQGRIVVVSPLAGRIGEIGITRGDFVSSGDLIAEVSDPARTELVFNAPPTVAAQMPMGARMIVNGPGGDIEATVVGVTLASNANSHGAARVRARPVSDVPLPAGLVVTATLVTDQQGNTPVVPAEAVQTVAGQTVVFVVVADGHFRATPVLAGRRAGDRIEILKGLSGDERIAATHAFLLKAELAKGEAEHVH